MKKFQKTREVIIYAQKYISGRTLDFGAGSAKYSNFIKQKASEYVAFDVVDGKNIDVVGDVLNAPFENNSFDTIISTQVLEHVEKPWLMVKEIRRILKKDGICILTAPFLQPYHPDPADFFRYTTEGLISLFKNEGFSTIECDYYTELYSTMAEFIRFSCFDPYEKKNRTKNKERIIRYMQKITKYLDKFTKSKKIYSNSYIIAKKQ